MCENGNKVGVSTKQQQRHAVAASDVRKVFCKFLCLVSHALDVFATLLHALTVQSNPQARLVELSPHMPA